MDCDALSREICRALRAHRSQVQFSRRLGYRSNVAASWEAGRTAPTATTFLGACQTLDVPIVDGLSGFLGGAFPWLEAAASPAGVSALVGALIGGASAVELSGRTGISRHALGRWIRGEAQPRLPDLLRVVQAGTGRLLDFVDVVVDPSACPSIAERWARLVAGRRLLVEAPWVQPVLLSLELSAYTQLAGHSDAWLAERLSLSVDAVVDAIDRLRRTDQIAWTGTHWALHRVGTIDTRRDGDGVVAMRAWFGELCLQRLRDDQPDATFSQNLFTISEADLARLRALHIAQFREMQALIAASEPGERIVMLQRWVVPFDRAPCYDRGASRPDPSERP